MHLNISLHISIHIHIYIHVYRERQRCIYRYRDIYVRWKWVGCIKIHVHDNKCYTVKNISFTICFNWILRVMKKFKNNKILPKFLIKHFCALLPYHWHSWATFPSHRPLQPPLLQISWQQLKCIQHWILNFCQPTYKWHNQVMLFENNIWHRECVLLDDTTGSLDKTSLCEYQNSLLLQLSETFLDEVLMLTVVDTPFKAHQCQSVHTWSKSISLYKW